MKTRFHFLAMLIAAAFFLLPTINADAARMVRQRVSSLKGAEITEDPNTVYIRVCASCTTDVEKKEVCFDDVIAYLNAESLNVDEGTPIKRLQQIIGETDKKFDDKKEYVFYLTEDINFNPNYHHINLIPENVTLDGRYHKINISPTGEETTVNITLQEQAIEESTYYVGGVFIGKNEGKVTRLEMSAEYDFYQTDVFANGDSGDRNVILSAFCGINTGTIDECLVKINGFEPSNGTRPASGEGEPTITITNSYMGGIVGYNNGTIKNTQSRSQFSSSLNATTAAEGTAVGYATATSNVKNVIAEIGDGAENTSFAGNKVSGNVSGFVASNYTDNTEETNVIKFDNNKEGDELQTKFKNLIGDEETALGYFADENNADSYVELIGFKLYGDEGIHGAAPLISEMLHQPNPAKDGLYLYDGENNISEAGLNFLNKAMVAMEQDSSFMSNLGFNEKKLSFYKEGTTADGEQAPTLNLSSRGETILEALPSGWILDGKLSDAELGDMPGQIVTSQSLVGTIAEGATVKNISILVEEENQSKVIDETSSAFGSIAIVNNGNIENIKATGAYQLIPAVNYDTDPTSYYDLYAGSIVGVNNGSIKTVWTDVRASIEGGKEKENKVGIGGIAGQNKKDAIIKDAFVYSFNEDNVPVIILTNGENTTGNIGYIAGEGEGSIENAYRSAFDNSLFQGDVPEGEGVYDISIVNENVTINDETGKLYFRVEGATVVEKTKLKTFYNEEKTLFNFANLDRWKMEKEIEEKIPAAGVAPIIVETNLYPTLNFTECEETFATIQEDEDGEEYVDFDVNDVYEYDAVAQLIVEANDVYGNANVTINADLDLAQGMPEEYLKQEWSPETTIDQVIELPTFGTTDKPFIGSLDGNGNTLSNMVGAFIEGSLFGQIGTPAVTKEEEEDVTETAPAQVATVKNFTIENSRFFVDITKFKPVLDESKGKWIIYIPVFAEQLTGTATAMNFSGSLYYDDAKLAQIVDSYEEITKVEDLEVVICLVSNATEAEGSSVNNSFLYLFTDEDKAAEADDNKACIVIKQNVGVGRGKANKTATSKLAAVNKAGVANFDFANFRTKDTEEFTAEEFASGEVAAWLNYKGKGFSGDFTAMYAQGNDKPKLATNKSGAVQIINYSTENLEGEIGDFISGPVFAASGEDVEIEYMQKAPKAVSLATSETGAGSSQAISDSKVSFTMPASETGMVYLKSVYEILSESVEITAEGDEYKLSAEKKSLQLTATVSPASADNKDVTWGIVSGEDIAEISEDGLLSYKVNYIGAGGTIKVKAIAADGSGAFAEKDVEAGAIDDKGEAISYLEGSNIRVAKVTGGIRIIGAAGQTAVIATTIGQVAKIAIDTDSQVVELPRGLYVIRIGNFVTKKLVQ